MVWWGYDIMEGDTPLDCQGDIQDYLADPDLVAIVREDRATCMEDMDAVSASANAALKFPVNVIAAMKAIQDGELCDYDQTIAMQVLGEMVMCSGGVLPQEVRAACVAAAEAEMQYSDKGRKAEGERDKCLKAYIARVWAFVDGVAFEPTGEGLFAKIGQALGTAEDSLINTNR